MYSVPRTILPHGASFNGHPVTLHITYESTKDTFTLEVLKDFVLESYSVLKNYICREHNCCVCVCALVHVLQTHSNDTIGSIRWKIAEHLSCPVDNVQIFANDSVVSVHLNVFKAQSHLSVPHQSISPLSQSRVSPEVSAHLTTRQ